ncbi:MAG TPA: MBL fold metallo-hydrolase [Thermoanaerobaculia bacterium]|nr:MBL fold metallo-hydrolase [Thermoanaerobaculia bacterium]
MNFGSLRLDLLHGGDLRLDGSALFGVIPKVLWERRFPADDRNRIRVAAHCLLVRGADFTALVEAGVGDKWDEETRERRSIAAGPSLAEQLARIGVRPDQVDALVLSRLQSDHAGGATVRGEGCAVRLFPRATLYVQSSELDRARAPGERERASYEPENWEPYAEAGRLETVDGEREIRPGVRVTPLAGQAAGMQGVRIDSEGRTAFFFADAVPTSAHVPIPWLMEEPLYPIELIQNKKRWIDQAAREGWLCLFEHDPDVPWGRIVDGIDGQRRVYPLPAAQREFP